MTKTDAAGRSAPAIPLALALALAAVLAGCTPGSDAANAPAAASPAVPAFSPAGLAQVPLTIRSGRKTHRFTVELAQSPAEQSQGMMFRTELAPDRGMLFPFATDRPATFWMKNTVIPLDIIFVRRDGSIESIAANAVPYSLDIRASGEPVAAVLELAGGRAAELGLKPGDKVRWETR